MFREERQPNLKGRFRRLALHRDGAPMRRERCALVLSGGSVFGAAQIGHAKALLEGGIVPDVILGCSVGALNGAYLAGRLDLVRVRELEDIWAGLSARDVFSLRSHRTVANLVAGRDHLCNPNGLRSLIRRFCPVSDLSDLAVELHVVTTNLDTARPSWWTSGDPASVLAASAALPGIFPPVEIAGSRHVDGGVLVPVPLTRAVELGCTRIFVSDIGTHNRPHLPDRLGPLGVLLEAFNVARFAIEADATPPPGVEVTTLPSPCLEGLSMFDFGHTRRLVEDAYRSTRTFLAAAPLEAAV
jgi:NTE family protein